jgi:hypothetical protein
LLDGVSCGAADKVSDCHHVFNSLSDVVVDFVDECSCLGCSADAGWDAAVGAGFSLYF